MTLDAVVFVKSSSLFALCVCLVFYFLCFSLLLSMASFVTVAFPRYLHCYQRTHDVILTSMRRYCDVVCLLSKF